MPIETPGKRPAPILQNSKVFGKGHGGRKSGNADLLITPLVDMFVIIVIFLLMNFSATGEVLFMSKDIVLPPAANTQEILRAPVVQVSLDSIMLEGELVARIDDLTRDEYWNIPQLEEKLRDLKKKFEFMHQGDTSGQFKGDINIQAHKEVQFKAIKRVMYSCNQAGYFNINFAVMTVGGASAKPDEKGGAAAGAAAPAAAPKAP
jgi:biopolymer transport protein ExbD